jgi:lipid A oxidase
MVLAQFHSIGWRHRAPRSASADAGRILRASILVLGAGFTGGLIWASASDVGAATALLNRFGSLHNFFGAALLSGVLFAGLSLFSGVAAGVLAIAEGLPQVAVGGALPGVLPFAQVSGAQAGKPGTFDASSAARSEMQVGFYMGKSVTPRSDVTMTAPDDTDITLKDVKWRPDSFKPSPYYGARAIDWNSRFPALGAMVDYTHAKATADRAQTVSQSGKRSGKEVPPSEPFEATFRKLEFTHGLNFLTINGVYRAAGLHRRIIPYAGIGIGFTIPFVHGRLAGRPKSEEVLEAQLTGVAIQVLGGIEWRIFKSDRRSLFTEYKLTHTSHEVKLREGREVKTNILIHQFNVGGYYTPWRQGTVAAAK